MMVIYVTAKNEKEANKIANTLITEKLAACVNIFPIKSTYRWKGKIEKANESALIIKTKGTLVDDVIKRVKEIHSYTVPCIISLPVVKGNKDFLSWIKEVTK